MWVDDKDFEFNSQGLFGTGELITDSESILGNGNQPGLGLSWENCCVRPGGATKDILVLMTMMWSREGEVKV